MRGSTAPIALAASMALIFGTCLSAPAQESESFGYVTDDSIDRTLEEVLSAPEFRYLLRDKREPDKRTASKAPERKTSGEPVEEEDDSSLGALIGQLVRMLALAAVAAVVVVIAFVVIRSFFSRSPQTTLASDANGAESTAKPTVLVHSPGEIPAEGYRERAVRLAEGGSCQDAIRELLLGSMSWIERAGWIRHQRGLTNRDYGRAARGDPRVQEAFDVIVRRFDEVFFGRREASDDRFRECLAAFENGFPRAEDDRAVAH